MELQVKIDEKAFGLEMKVFKDQIPFAISRAINETMKVAQNDIRGHINREFTLRRKPFIDRSIKITEFANKRTLTGRLAVEPPGGGNDVLSQHEDGGMKRPISGKSIAIPLKAIQPDKKRVISKAKRPKALKKAFKTKDGKLLLIKKGRGKNAKVEPAYLLVRQARIEPRLQFEEKAMAAVRRVWSDEFAKSWDYAVKTALK